jgi:hypothetical protein
MFRVILLLLMLSGCTGLAFNTTLANEPEVRNAMLTSVRPGVTTERDVTTRWGRPTQKIREGAEVSYVYRDMRNPPGFYAPQFGNSGAYVVIVFQFGLAVGAYSSDAEGCRATFAPRPPGHGFDNPSTVKPVNCGPTTRPLVTGDPAPIGASARSAGSGSGAGSAMRTTAGSNGGTEPPIPRGSTGNGESGGSGTWTAGKL